jgi:outer membrane protein assembly factor BamB
VRGGGRGDVNGSHVLWDVNRGTEICTPVYHDGHLYFSDQENGTVWCLHAASGETIYHERLQPPSRNIYASAVLADGRIYYVSRENGTYVVAAKPQFELLAHNEITADSSIFNATPAISGDRLLIRSNQCLYCIGAN